MTKCYAILMAQINIKGSDLVKKKRSLSFILASVLLIGTLAACTPTTQQPVAPVGDTATPAQQQAPTPPSQAAAPEPEQAAHVNRGVTLAIASETPSVAPARHTALIGQFKNMLTHNGLFRTYYEDLSPVPDLIASWVALSDTLFEFTLHEGILFHNGEELTAYDVVISLAYSRNYPEAVAVHGSVYQTAVIDRYTFTIDTGTPNAMLFFDLAHHGNMIMPSSLIEAGHDFMAEPIGTGPFVFYEWRFGDSLTFTAFEDYFDTSRFPQVEYVHWRVIPEGASRTIALETGEVDYIVEVAFPDIPRLEENPDITVFQRPGVTYSYLILNNDHPTFSSVYVRRAIEMALDKDAMVIASLDGFGIPIWTSVPPMFPGASTEGTNSFDPDGARALLAEHGIDPASIAFDILAFDESQRRRGEVVQSNLADIGIHVTITMIDFATWLTVAGTPTSEAAFGNFTGQGNILNFMRTVLHIDGIDAQNRSRLYSRELSDLIDEAVATIDINDRLAVLEEATTLSNELVAHIGTNMNILIRAFDSRLVSPEISANGFMFLNMVYWAE